MEAQVNGSVKDQGDRMHSEYKYIEKWLIKDGRFMNGIDVGCGTNRLAPEIVSLDKQADYDHSHGQLVWDCHDLEIFNNGVLDFIFSSHVLEDFEDIPVVFLNWWRKLKVNGLMILLLPDMETGRYAKVGEVGPDGKPGNPSHRTNVGRNFIDAMLTGLHEKGKIKYIMEQVDTIPHNESCSIDFVIRKKS